MLTDTLAGLIIQNTRLAGLPSSGFLESQNSLPSCGFLENQNSLPSGGFPVSIIFCVGGLRVITVI